MTASPRTLALDMDGVVNSAIWFEKMACDALSRRPISHMIDPECVARLNTILELSGADVVISSSWRILHTVAEIDSALKEKGFTGNIIGATPKYRSPRGREIQEWMTDEGRDIDQLVILDDDADMAHLTPCLVRTSWSVGLTDDDVAVALSLFGITMLTDESEQPVPGTYGETVLASGSLPSTSIGLPSLLTAKSGEVLTVEEVREAVRVMRQNEPPYDWDTSFTDEYEKK